MHGAIRFSYSPEPRLGLRTPGRSAAPRNLSDDGKVRTCSYQKPIQSRYLSFGLLHSEMCQHQPLMSLSRAISTPGFPTKEADIYPFYSFVPFSFFCLSLAGNKGQGQSNQLITISKKASRLLDIFFSITGARYTKSLSRRLLLSPAPPQTSDMGMSFLPARSTGAQGETKIYWVMESRLDN